MWVKIKQTAKAVYSYIASRPADTWLHITILGILPSFTIGVCRTRSYGLVLRGYSSRQLRRRLTILTQTTTPASGEISPMVA